MLKLSRIIAYESVLKIGPCRTLQNVKKHAVSLKTSCRWRYPIIPFKFADFGEGIREVAIKEVFVNVGDSINQFDDVCQVESDKASISVTSRYDGVVKKIYYKIGDVALVGSTFFDIETEDLGDGDAENEETGAPALGVAVETNGVRDIRVVDNANEEAERWRNKALTTPAVRRIATENKLNINQVKGTGKGGRVIKEDVIFHLSALKESAANKATTTTTIVDIPEEVENVTRENKEKLASTAYKRVMVKTMTESSKIPTAVLSDEYDLTKLDEIRAELKNLLTADDDVKITLLPFFIKAVSLALSRYPILNATLHPNGDEVIFNDSHNVGVAIDTPSGLVAPNIKNVQHLNVRSISAELRRLQKCSADGGLSVQDISNGTFTLSNIGSIAGTVVRPLILPPQVAIGAVGRVQLLPRFDCNGNLVKSKIAVFSWSADHRVIDGATLGRFSNVVKRLLENPDLFLIEM